MVDAPRHHLPDRDPRSLLSGCEPSQGSTVLFPPTALDLRRRGLRSATTLTIPAFSVAHQFACPLHRAWSLSTSQNFAPICYRVCSLCFAARVRRPPNPCALAPDLGIRGLCAFRALPCRQTSTKDSTHITHARWPAHQYLHGMMPTHCRGAHARRIVLGALSSADTACRSG